MVRGMALTPRMVTIDCADPQKLASFWTQAAGYRVGGDWGGYVMLTPADEDGSIAIGLQQVDEPRAGKNRVHIDWHADDRVAEVERLARLGATVLAEHQVPGLAWTVLADPEGNEFCVAG
jgi:predicted enzyme related to lactoylglutathione lyase